MCDVVVVYRVGGGADVTRPRQQPAPGHCRHAPHLTTGLGFRMLTLTVYWQDSEGILTANSKYRVQDRHIARWLNFRRRNYRPCEICKGSDKKLRLSDYLVFNATPCL